MADVIEKLLRGFGSFRSNHFSGTGGLFEQLRHGQHPKVLVIACSDSRVDPALLLNCDPGDIFVIRNVANLIPPYEPGSLSSHHGVSAALEYAVCKLHVEHIIVLGHSDCGGIKALLGRKRADAEEAGEFLSLWLDLAEPAREAVERELPDAAEEVRRQACEEASLVLSAENLLTFPWLRERVERGELELHAWYFHLATGVLYGFDRESRSFTKL